MKIAIDLDGTAWYHEDFFFDFVYVMQQEGNEIGILTSHGEDMKEDDLRKWRFMGLGKPDFYICKSHEDKDRLKLTAGNNGTWKAEKVTEHNIDYLMGDLDGNDVYVEHFRKVHPYKLIRFWGDK